MAKTKRVHKRRKVWVNFYEDGSNDGCSFETKTDAAENASTAYRMKQVRFTETRPGDVVLSRGQRQTLAVIVKWMDDSTDGRFKVIVEPELRALLRGGR